MKKHNWMSFLVVPLVLAVVLLYQNCAPDAPGGGGLFKMSSDADLDPGPQYTPPEGDPPVLSATPPPGVPYYVVQKDASWNPGADTLQNDPVALQQLTADNAAWYQRQATGPVATYKMNVTRLARSGNVVPNPTPDARGCLQVKVGDTVWVDTTQKNGAGVAQCKWTNMITPTLTWFSSNEPQFFSSPKDFQPFWVRFKPQVAGVDLWLYATLDGIRSNDLCLTTK